MPVLSLVVPAILYGSAGTQILKSVVHAVSVLVVNDSVSLELHAAEICHNEMQHHSAALDIAISVDRPARPRQPAPHLSIHQELVFCIRSHII